MEAWSVSAERVEVVALLASAERVEVAAWALAWVLAQVLAAASVLPSPAVSLEAGVCLPLKGYSVGCVGFFYNGHLLVSCRESWTRLRIMRGEACNAYKQTSFLMCKSGIY